MVYCFLTILLLTGILCNAQRNCSLSLFENCLDDTAMPDFPEKESEMDEYCRIHIENLQCIAKYEKQCIDFQGHTFFADTFATVLTKICDKDYHYYQGFVDSLPCIKPVMTNSEICEIGETVIKDTRSYVSKLIDDDSYNNTGCLALLYNAGCIMSEIRKECDQIARQTHREIYEDILRTAGVCNEKIIEMFPKFVEEFGQIKYQEETIEVPEILAIAEPNCRLSYNDNCLKSVPKFVFPEHEAEMNRMCKIYTGVYDCIGKYYTECQKGPDYLAFSKAYASTLNRVCDKNSEYYDVVADHLGCAKPVLMDGDICERDPYILKELVDFISNSYNGNPFENIFCLVYVYEFGCKASKLEEQCGKTVQETYTQMFQELLGSLNICNYQIVKKLPAIVDTYGEAEKGVEEFKNLLKELSLGTPTLLSPN